MKTISTFLISLFLFNVVTVVSAEPTEVTDSNLNITILYDNYIFTEGLQTDWGFACLIEGLDRTILFDTGTHGNILLGNAKKLGANLKDIEVLAISHDHRDHYGGMDDFLKQNNNVDVYLLKAFSKERAQTVQRHGATVFSVKGPRQICKGAWLTGELGTQIKEQALVLDTKEGLVVITGCSHPGVVSMVKKACEIIPNKNIHMVFGGFHMPRSSQDEIKDTIKAFRDLGVQYAGPSHCSGDHTIAMFRQAYGENFIKLGVGKRIKLASSNSTHSQPKKMLRLGVNNWYFWRKYENGKFSGADVDVWREIAGRNNLVIEYIFMPDMEKLKTAMETNSIDVFVSMRKNPERERYMFFIEPPFRTKLKFLTYIRANSNVKIDKYEDMNGKSIAMVGGNYDRINNNTNIWKINCGWNPSKAFKMLLNKDVDAVHINQWLALDFFRDRKDKDKFELAKYTYSEYHACYVVMSKKSPLAEKWKDLFGRTIQQMIDNGTMKRIIDSYAPDWYESYPPGFQK
ncbi:MAG: transporter substrate-binding domain-containing protein [Sedimentisphaerales bacterium]|nr:transporter substrate-binding domain-containing protein [Sedimentisphaerales bacterium]